MPYFPPHLQRVATLPCEKHNIKNSKVLMYITRYHRFALLLTTMTKYSVAEFNVPLDTL